MPWSCGSTPPAGWSLPAAARGRLARIAGRRQNDVGVIVIDAQRFRSLDQNKADARARLEAMIHAALVEPKRRRKTRPTRASIERRLAVEGARCEGQAHAAARDPRRLISAGLNICTFAYSDSPGFALPRLRLTVRALDEPGDATDRAVKITGLHR